MTHQQQHHGFTLLELMIVLAIVGILSAVAVPQYANYSKRARFSEVVLATTNFKSPAEVAIQTGRATSIADLDAGSLGIPKAIGASGSPGQYIASVNMTDGVITATGTAAVDNALYVIRATVPAGTQGLRWSEDDSNANSCQKLGIC